MIARFNFFIGVVAYNDSGLAAGCGNGDHGTYGNGVTETECCGGAGIAASSGY